MRDIEYYDVLVVIYVDQLIIDSESEIGCQVEVFIFVFEYVERSYLSIDEFVAELRKKELRIFFTHLVEMFTYFCIKAYS